MDIVERGDGHDDGRSGNRSFGRTQPQIAVAAREAGGRETKIELAVSGGEVSQARGQKAPRREVIGWQRYPAASVGWVGDELTVQFVQRVRKPGEILRRGVRSEIDVLGVITAAVGLDRGATDQHERHAMTREHTE